MLLGNPARNNIGSATLLISIPTWTKSARFQQGVGIILINFILTKHLITKNNSFDLEIHMFYNLFTLFIIITRYSLKYILLRFWYQWLINPRASFRIIWPYGEVSPGRKFWRFRVTLKKNFAGLLWPNLICYATFFYCSVESMTL